MRLHLDGGTIDSEVAFHAAVRVASGIDWYGGNLDALADLLEGLVEAPIEVIWTNAAVSRLAIGDRFDSLLRVILDAIETRGRNAIKLTLES
ncbi:MAG: barstar family protein [Sphingomonas sp.]